MGNGEGGAGFFRRFFMSIFAAIGAGDSLIPHDAEQGPDNLEVSIYHHNLYLGV